MTEPTYVYREDIEAALDVKPSAYMAREVDRACRAGSRMVDGFCHRTFYPVVATRTFDYPGPRATALKLWLDDQELISATEVTSDGVTIPADTGYLLRPDNGPPFNRIEIERDSTYSFAGGPQRAISITGLWGFRNSEVAETPLAAAVSTTSATTMDVNIPAGGIGAVLRVDDERFLITGKTFVAASLAGSTLAAANNAISLTVTDGTLFTELEILLIDAERVQVVDIAGNTLLLRRAVGGTALAAHSLNAQIYWQHRLRVTRGALGTTAATHLISASVYRWDPPSLVSALAQAYAEDEFLQANAGYARTSGQGDNERPVTGTGIKALEQRMLADYARRARSRAV